LLSLAAGLLLGLLLGVRHALEPDHLAAVSVLVTRRGNPAGGVVLGAAWGLGHSLALLGVGCVLAALGARLPPRLAAVFELLVAVMLMTLGARALLRARSRSPVTPHRHEHSSRWTMARQPFVVGLIHGLAGSGALTALAVAGLPTPMTRLIYMGLFGLGSVAGMACLTGIAGWPLARLGACGKMSRRLSLATGALSIVLGLVWGWAAVHVVASG
jgi:nickel/cobalt exporter